MRYEKDKLFTLEQDIQSIWEAHGWEVIKETVPQSSGKESTIWIIEAKPKHEAKKQKR